MPGCDQGEIAKSSGMIFPKRWLFVFMDIQYRHPCETLISTMSWFYLFLNSEFFTLGISHIILIIISPVGENQAVLFPFVVTGVVIPMPKCENV